MYNALTPLFNHVTNADLTTDFKSEKFGTAGQCPCSTEPVPYPGVTIIRDKYDVPHVSATTHAGGVWASGWIAAEDRGLLLSQARYDSLVAAIDAPGLSAIGLIENLDSFTPSAQTERVVSRQTQVLLKAGPEGRDVLRDIDTFVQGINAYNAIHNPTEAKFTRNDIYALQRAQGPVLRRGRRQPGPELRVPVGTGEPARHQQGLQRVRRPAPEPQRGQPDHRRRHVQLQPRPLQAGLARERAAQARQLQVRDVRHDQGHRRPRLARAAAPRLQRADGRGQVLGDRPPAARRRSAGRLLLPRPDVRDRHARARAWTGAERPRRRSPATC